MLHHSRTARPPELVAVPHPLNWSQLDLTSELGASTTSAALTLTAFWGMVTLGRVLFAAVQTWLPARVTYPSGTGMR